MRLDAQSLSDCYGSKNIIMSSAVSEAEKKQLLQKALQAYGIDTTEIINTFHHMWEQEAQELQETNEFKEQLKKLLQGANWTKISDKLTGYIGGNIPEGFYICGDECNKLHNIKDSESIIDEEEEVEMDKVIEQLHETKS